MPYFGAQDNAYTALASPALTGATSLTVVAASNLPTLATAHPSYRVLLWDPDAYTEPGEDPHAEYRTVSNVAGNVLTITAGLSYDHAAGQRLANVWDAASKVELENALDARALGVASSVAGNFASYAGTGGKQLADSGSKAADFATTAVDYPWAYAEIVRAVHQIVGSANLLGLWFPGHATGTTVTDWSGNGRNGTEGADGSTFSPAYVGKVPTLLRGSGTYRGFSVPDADAFSFGNGTTDSAFWIATCGELVTSAASATLLAKYNATTGSTKREWQFWTDASAYLYFTLYDESAGARIGRYYGTALGQTWSSYIADYDGSRASSGIKLYVAGTRVDDHDYNSGSYVAMENTAAVVGPMTIAAGGSQTGGFKGRQGAIALGLGTMTTAQMMLLDLVLRSCGGVQV